MTLKQSTGVTLETTQGADADTYTQCKSTMAGVIGTSIKIWEQERKSHTKRRQKLVRSLDLLHGKKKAEATCLNYRTKDFRIPSLTKSIVAL